MIDLALMIESENRRLLACAFALLLFCAVPMLRALEVSTSAQDNQTIKAIPELVGTRYCYADSEVYSVLLKLRMKYVNRTQKTPILDKEIGKAWYGEKVARNLADLAAGKYEYNPTIDWFFSNKDKLPDKPNADYPNSDFVLLAPGDAFVGEMNVGVVAQYENPKNFAGSIRSGDHVLQLDLSAWNHPGEASAFGELWRKSGELVTGVIKTEPLEIRIPSDPKVEKLCK
jgi:hypothetical protein